MVFVLTCSSKSESSWEQQ